MPERSMTRRVALSAGTAGIAMLGGTRAEAQANTRKTFVLIHGAYHGGWCWRRTADILESHGHKVYAPSLTGNGDRSHLLSKDVNLDTHIADIVNLVNWEDLKDICLVPHSYGGWPASGALEQIHGRVAAIVWLDAFKPEDGQKGTDYVSEFSRKAMEEAVARGEPGRKPPPGKTFSKSEKDYAWIDFETVAAAERTGAAADQADRQARRDCEENLHPRAAISASRLRQGAGGVQGRPVVADLGQRHDRPRRHDRPAGMAGGCAVEGVVANIGDINAAARFLAVPHRRPIAGAGAWLPLPPRW